MRNVFLDTNVLIDYFGSRNGFPEAATIVTLAQRQKIRLYVSSLSFATAGYILSAHHKRSHAEFMNLFDRFTTLCHVTTVDADTVSHAIHSDFHDFEDAFNMILRSQHSAMLSLRATSRISRHRNSLFTNRTSFSLPSLAGDFYKLRITSFRPPRSASSESIGRLLFRKPPAGIFRFPSCVQCQISRVLFYPRPRMSGKQEKQCFRGLG